MIICQWHLDIFYGKQAEANRRCVRFAPDR
jgi:hypothetical protein